MDLILREDSYDQIIKGPTPRIDDQVHATWTVFGWMVPGCGAELNGVI